MKKFISFILFIWFLLLVLPFQSNAFYGLPWDTKKRIDAIRDRDGDTRIECEHAIDEDKIRLYTAGTERVVVDENGNIAIDTDALYYDKANKRWGFGTTEPGYKLDVNGTVRIGDFYNLGGKLNIAGAGNQILAIGTGSSGGGIVELIGSSSQYGSCLRFDKAGTDYWDITDVGSTNNLRIYSYQKTGGADTVVTIDTDGNVGIGTTDFGTNAQKVLGLGLGQAPESNPADMIQVWGEDLNGAGTCGLKMMDELGNTWTVMGVASSQGVSTGAGSIKMNSANGADNAGWLAITKEDGTTVYIPYWSTATP